MGMVLSIYDQIARLVSSSWGAGQGVRRNDAGDGWEFGNLARLIDVHPGLLSGSRYKSDFLNYNGSSGTVVTGRLFAVPIIIPHPCTIATLSLDQVTNGSAGTVHRLGLYGNGGGGVPTTLLVDGGTLAADTGGTAIRSVTINYAITRPQTVWIAVSTNSGGNFNRTATNTVGFGAYNGVIAVQMPARAHDPTTALPSPFGAISNLIDPNGTIPRLSLTVA